LPKSFYRIALLSAVLISIAMAAPLSARRRPNGVIEQSQP
jgi:hypothetical protein